MFQVQNRHPIWIGNPFLGHEMYRGHNREGRRYKSFPKLWDFEVVPCAVCLGLGWEEVEEWQAKLFPRVQREPNVPDVYYVKKSLDLKKNEWEILVSAQARFHWFS